MLWRTVGVRVVELDEDIDEGFLDVKQGKQEDSETWRASNQDIEFMVSERSGRAGTWSACSVSGILLPVAGPPAEYGCDPASLFLSSDMAPPSPVVLNSASV